MSGWISVKNRLPKKYQYVLAASPNGDMVVACVFDYDEDVVFWKAQVDMGLECDMDFDPVCWMPLPELPKEEIV